MAFILIDGYNLIGTAHGNLQKARDEIIETLRKYAANKDHEITLVFDGWKNGQREESRIKTANLTIIYSRLGEKADQTIIRILSSSTKPWIVVSSDREIADFAENKDLAAISSDDFEDKLSASLLHSQRSTENTSHPSKSFSQKEESYSSPLPSKGNPRKLSRKERRRVQAIKKL